VKPLTNLIKKGHTFKWTPEYEDAFQKLKQHFQEGPILIMADHTKPFYLQTDTSAFASGTVLMQKDDNGEVVVDFVSL
jgi:hypothetical protein